MSASEGWASVAVVNDSLPPVVEIMRDVSAADWILTSLRPWDGRIWNFMPDSFESYARVLHPFEYPRPDGSVDWKTWEEVGSQGQVTISADVSFEEVIGTDEYPPTEVGFSYNEGELPGWVCAKLVSLLVPQTSTPERAWFCIWGTELSKGTPLVAADTPPRVRRQLQAESHREARAIESIAKVRFGGGHDYVLLRGPIAAATTLGPFPDYPITARLWWPEDRAWLVYTSSDGHSTYVGGTETAIRDILGSDIEAVEVTVDALIR